MFKKPLKDWYVKVLTQATVKMGLEVHGLDRCLDHGIDGFKRYVALAIVARNIHRIGDILHKREEKELQRKARKKLKAANAGNLRLAA